MTEREILARAKKKVQEKKGFYTHFAIYCLGVIFFFTINYLTSPEFWWAFFPTLGWGMGIVGHFINVFGIPSLKGDDWEETQLNKEINKLERQQGIKSTFDEDITVPDEELELKEFKKLREEWDDRDFV